MSAGQPCHEQAPSLAGECVQVMAGALDRYRVEHPDMTVLDVIGACEILLAQMRALTRRQLQ